MQLVIETVALIVYESINSHIIFIFCMINELSILFNINITEKCFNFIGESLSSTSFSCFWILFHNATSIIVVLVIKIMLVPVR